MNDELKELTTRSGGQCELCSANTQLAIYKVPKSPNVGTDASVLICDTCHTQLENPEKVDVNHWRCLNDSMWSQVPGVQVIAWRMLTRLRAEGWPQELLEMLYLDDETLEWAKATGEADDPEDTIVHKDANGGILQAGDTVVLIKDLVVKGANFTAKRGTAVRNISLVHDNASHIEGRVNGQQIILLTQYVKKSTA